MPAIHQAVKKEPLYFWLFSLVLLLAFIPACFHSRVDCFILLNQLHNRWLDTFFICITNIGNGLFIIPAALVILFIQRKIRLGFHIILSFLLSGLMVQLLKNLFHAPRPRTAMGAHLYAHFIHGVTHSGFASFPSGHATSIFAFVTIMVLYIRKPKFSILLLTLAILVCYSRIYLGQHFLEDVLGGMLLGVITSLLVYCYIPFPARLLANSKLERYDYLS